MGFSAADIMEFISENDIKFVRLAFCDIFGIQKNIAILSEHLPQAFSEGIKIDTLEKDSLIYEKGHDVYLFPEPDTFSILPWRPSHGRVIRLFCSMRHSDGQPYESDCRHLLRKAVEKSRTLGFDIMVDCECEFYLFQLDEDGQPCLIPHDKAGYCDIFPLDKGENVRREICLALEDMRLAPTSSHHERGPGQNEISFQSGDALSAADGLVSFRLAAKVIAAQNGLHASFMPKPLKTKNGSSVHLNLSLYKNGQNLFSGETPYSADAKHFLAGIIDKMRDLTLFFHPVTNSYTRIGHDIPAAISWAPGSSDSLIRLPNFNTRQSYLELRSPDSALNPYLAFALLIEAGLAGIEDELPLVWEYKGGPESLLPGDLHQAISLARYSKFINQLIPAPLLEKYLKYKEEEFQLWAAAEDALAYDHQKFFARI